MMNGPATYLCAYLAERDVVVRRVQMTGRGDYVVHSPRGIVEVSGPVDGAKTVPWARRAADQVADALVRPRSWREEERRRILGLRT